jgi:hypothetical protein
MNDDIELLNESDSFLPPTRKKRGSRIRRVGQFRLNVNAIKRRRKINYSLYATGPLSCAIGILGSGVYSSIIIDKKRDAENKKIESNYYKQGMNKWTRSIYYAARLNGVNKSCQELAPFKLKMNPWGCYNHLIDTNNDVYERCFPKNESLLLDTSCNHIFGSFSTYASCATIFNKEYPIPLKQAFQISCESPSFFLGFGGIIGVLILFLIGLSCVGCSCSIYLNANDISISKLPELEQDQLADEFGQLSDVHFHFEPKYFREKSLNSLENELVKKEEEIKKINQENSEKKLKFLTQFYYRDKETGSLAKLEHCPPKPILHKILFFANLMEEPPDEESNNEQNSNLSFFV